VAECPSPCLQHFNAVLLFADDDSFLAGVTCKDCGKKAVKKFMKSEIIKVDIFKY